MLFFYFDVLILSLIQLTVLSIPSFEKIPLLFTGFCLSINSFVCSSSRFI